jgi:NAD(P)-dependent dehydrogenase (short-subunit alcohol dehydrogenase family)
MLSSLFDLTGRTALVTGGSKGIGKAVARAYAEAGADVLICARHEDELQAAVREIAQAAPVRVEYAVADMLDRARVDQLAGEALQRMGKVDILFNNAGNNRPQVLTQTTDDVWDEILELNFTSCMRLTRALAPGMIERRWGRIISTSSVMAFASNPGRASYSSTKAALIGMTRALALELGPFGVTVNCLAPGPILTDLSRNLLSDEQKQRFIERTAVKRYGRVEDMVGPMLLLSSDAGAFITGTTLLADGGMLCRTFD